MVSAAESPTVEVGGRTPRIETKALARMTEMIMCEGYTFADALNISHEQLESLYAWGYDLQKRGQFEQAENVFQYLCYLNQFDQRGWIALGYCRERLKQLDRALHAYITAGLIDVDNPIPALRTAECLLHKGELSAAKSAAEMVCDLAGDAPEYRQRRNRAEQLLKIIDKRQRKRKPTR
jgi:type III secretion system low calcium response chaperone LcrH/SycD